MQRIDNDGQLRVAQMMRDWVRVIEIADGRLDYAVPDGISEDIGPEIRDALFKLTGMRWQVELGNDAGAPTLREQEEAEKSAADAALREEPLVKATLEAFPDAEILDDKAVVAQAGGRKWNR